MNFRMHSFSSETPLSRDIVDRNPARPEYRAPNHPASFPYTGLIPEQLLSGHRKKIGAELDLIADLFALLRGASVQSCLGIPPLRA